jgi:hypothetical protein
VDHEEMRKEGKDPLDEYNKRFDDQNDDDNDVEYEGENNDDAGDVEDERVIMDLDNHDGDDDDDDDIVRDDALVDEDAISIDVQKEGR